MRFSPCCGCGSKTGTQNGTLANGNMDNNLRSPVGLFLTHTLYRSGFHFNTSPAASARRQRERRGALACAQATCGLASAGASGATKEARPCVLWLGYCFSKLERKVGMIFNLGLPHTPVQRWTAVASRDKHPEGNGPTSACVHLVLVRYAYLALRGWSQKLILWIIRPSMRSYTLVSIGAVKERCQGAIIRKT